MGERDKTFADEVRKCLKKLPPHRIGRNGQLLEWFEEYEEAEPGHRHISHLYALHPAFQIRAGQKDACQRALVGGCQDNPGKQAEKRRRSYGLEPGLDYEFLCKADGWTGLL